MKFSLSVAIRACVWRGSQVLPRRSRSLRWKVWQHHWNKLSWFSISSFSFSSSGQTRGNTFQTAEDKSSELEGRSNCSIHFLVLTRGLECQILTRKMRFEDGGYGNEHTLILGSDILAHLNETDVKNNHVKRVLKWISGATIPQHVTIDYSTRFIRAVRKHYDACPYNIVTMFLEVLNRDPIQQKRFGLSFCVKNSLRFHFDSDTCLSDELLKFFFVKGISSQNSSNFSNQNSSSNFFTEGVVAVVSWGVLQWPSRASLSATSLLVPGKQS